MTTRQSAYTDRAAGPLRRRARLGLSLSSHPEQEGGARVLAVSSGSSAERMGVAMQDVIVAIDDRAVAGPLDLAEALAAARAGDSVKLELIREHEPLLLCGELLARPVEPLTHATIELVEVPAAIGRLRGLWTRPKRSGGGPLVFYLQTSDWGSCEHPHKPRHPETRLINALSGAGMSTFRLERSGTGDSEGPPATELDLHTERAWLAAGLRWLARQPEVEPGKLVLLGNSLGGMLAPLLASELGQSGEPLELRAQAPEALREKSAAGVREHELLGGLAVIGTSACGWHKSALGSFRRQAERAGRLPEAIERELAQLAALQQLVFCDGLTIEQAYRRAPELDRERFHWLREERAYERVVTYFQQLQAIDLLDAWQRIRWPVLVLHGEDDWICTAEQAQAIAAAVNGERPGLAHYRQLPGVDHGLAQPGAVERVAASLRDWWEQRESP